MKLFKHLGYLLNLVAISLFIPGIILPMFALNMDLVARISGAALNNNLINKNLSLLQTITELWQDDRLLVASLISTFSIIIPISKFLLVSWAYLKRNSQIEQKVYQWVSQIGKWSMADVFVVAVFLAVLSTDHSQTNTSHQLALFGFKIDISVSSETISQLGAGFYYFASYCLLSLLGTQLSYLGMKASPVKP